MSTLAINLISQYQGDLGFDLHDVAIALAAQGNGDFAPIWSKYLEWDNVVITVQDELQPLAVPIYIKNVSDLAGAEGYHDDSGTIEGYVFVDTTRSGGDDPVTTLSHELLELWLDPYVSLTYKVGGIEFSAEVCDAVETETYKINGFAMSNFVYPDWFALPGPLGFDHMSKCTQVGEIMPGGYMSEKRGHRWVQVFGSPAGASKFDHKAHHRVNKRHAKGRK